MNQADCAHGGTPLTPAQSAYRAVHLEIATLIAIHAGSHGQARPGETELIFVLGQLSVVAPKLAGKHKGTHWHSDSCGRNFYVILSLACLITVSHSLGLRSLLL